MNTTNLYHVRLSVDHTYNGATYRAGELHAIDSETYRRHLSAGHVDECLTPVRYNDARVADLFRRSASPVITK